MPGLLRDLAALYQHIQDPNKDQRQRVQLMLAEDPNRFQSLVDSNIANNPDQLMQTLGLSNARFGGNKNAGSNIANAITNAPLSELEKAKRIKDLSDDTSLPDVANATKEVPALRAYNGMSNQSFQQSLPQLANAIGNPGNNMLTQNQSDMLAKSQGLPTALEVQDRQANIGMLNAEAASARANAANTIAENPGITAEAQSRVRKAATQKAADDYLDLYAKGHPGAFNNRSLVDIFNDPTLDQDIRAAIPISSKYGAAFDKEYQGYLQEQQRNLEKQIHGDNQAEITQRMRETFAHEAYAASGYQGDAQNYIDLYTGVDSPGAQFARQALGQGTPAQKQARINSWNANLAKVNGDIRSGKISHQGLQTEVETMLNAQLPGLTASGINVPQLKYDIVPNPNLRQKFGAATANPAYGLQTMDGGTVAPVKYDAGKDPNTAENPDDVIKANSIIKAINSKQVDLQAALSDPRVTPAMKKQILQHLNAGKGQ